MTIRRRAPLFLSATAALALLCALPLAACSTTKDTPVIGKAVDSMQGKKSDTLKRNREGANDALAIGDMQDALQYAAKAYGKEKTPEHALRYATLLRRNGEPDTALEILAPFAETADGAPLPHANDAILNEAAAAHIARGEFGAAEKLLTAVLNGPAAEPEEADAENLMGVVLDAKGAHKDAEQMYRAALSSWQGNPTTVMNNLGLNLASQGMFDQALLTLRQALVMAPDKQEIARNIQIVSDLRDSVVPRAPLQLTKPKPATHRDTCSCAHKSK